MPPRDVREDSRTSPRRRCSRARSSCCSRRSAWAPRAFPRWLRLSLGGGVLAVSVLALGFQEDDGWLWPYRWSTRCCRGGRRSARPGRLATFSSLGLALLAAAGAESCCDRRGAGSPGAAATSAAGGAAVAHRARLALLLLAIADRGARPPVRPLRRPGPARRSPIRPRAADVPAPQLHLPAERAEDNRRYLLWSTDGFPEIVNGRASTQPDLVAEPIVAMDGFPDSATVARLDELGVRSVVLHPDRIPGPQQAEAAGDGLGLEGLPLRLELGRARSGLRAAATPPGRSG